MKVKLAAPRDKPPETPGSAIAAEPWRGLPAAVADVIEPEIPALTEEILATIGSEVPEYARPLEGSFGRGIRVGVSEALRQFVALVRDPDAGREQAAERADLEVAADASAWALPGTIAALACPEEDLGRLGARLPPEALISS